MLVRDFYCVSFFCYLCLPVFGVCPLFFGGRAERVTSRGAAGAVGDGRGSVGDGGHLLFCFRAGGLSYFGSGLVGGFRCRGRRGSRLQSLKLMANKIARLCPSHVGLTRGELSLS